MKMLKGLGSLGSNSESELMSRVSSYDTLLIRESTLLASLKSFEFMKGNSTKFYSINVPVVVGYFSNISSSSISGSTIFFVGDFLYS